MADVIDLSTISQKAKGVNYDDLTPEEQAQIDALAQEAPEPEGQEVRTAFLVVINKDGSINISPDLDVPLVREHLPGTDEIYSSCQVIAKDIQVSEAAVATAQFMQQMAMAQMQQRETQKLVQGLNLPK